MDERVDRAPARAPRDERVSMGIAGLDRILHGGVTADRLYLLEGAPGTGKTTFALQFLLAGRALGERALYITLSETEKELRAAAASHGWDLDGIAIQEISSDFALSADAEQSILHPSEVELGETMSAIIATLERVQPTRVVFDSLSEMRLLAQDALRYRRQVLALKQFFSTRACTVFLIDDKTSDPGDLQLHSIAHGVISLEQVAQQYGTERRRLRIPKMRGMKYQGGNHDFIIDTGRVAVFPRLVAADHRSLFALESVTTGSHELDVMLGGGLVRGTNTLLMGPSGVGKTTTAAYIVHTALARGESAVYFLFDEGIPTMLARCKALGLDLERYLASGHLHIYPIDPAELSPGEFASRVIDAIQHDHAATVVIDSLNAYLHSMPGQNFLLLHLHELLSYLNQNRITTLVVLGQHGVVGEGRSDLDLSYLSDSILLFRYFEAKGEIHTALASVKSRTGQNERSIREFRLSEEHGLKIGAALAGFEGVLSGMPSYRGTTPMIAMDPS